MNINYKHRNTRNALVIFYHRVVKHLLTRALWAHTWRLVSLKSKDMVKKPFGPCSQTKEKKKAIWALAVFWFLKHIETVTGTLVGAKVACIK